MCPPLSSWVRRASGGERRAQGGGGDEDTDKIPYLPQTHLNLAQTTSRSACILVSPQERAHVHVDPERRVLAQPRHDVAMRAGGAGPSRLAHHASAHDESHVWREEVR